MAYTLTQQLESGMNNKGIATTKDIDDTPTGKTQQEINAKLTQGYILQNVNGVTEWVRTVRAYTLDFGASGDIIQDVNLMGAIVINQLVAYNVASVLVSYGNRVRVALDLAGDIQIPVADGACIVWEITRVNEGQPACIGVRYNYN